ncbi:POPLD (NUC188) domain-containing protein [Besnoitia besnoiti]|uniref:POPLD (NUC188) domain-containing protein n=1 Tax=Besnoitia besnoiti TaxID=94643 RepID=A0A2A9MAH2_BESBE|nr:POPLD (NUC188) domain-containing protein [Besnoitia besnoiti]PFH32607.1 POPLD (NUC188) domain-containing protein [Besnoitia besnoiti]
MPRSYEPCVSFPPLTPLPALPTEERAGAGAAGSAGLAALQEALRSASSATPAESGGVQLPALPQLLSIPALVRAREAEVRALLTGLRHIPHHLHAKQRQQREQTQQLRRQIQQEQLPRKQRRQQDDGQAEAADEGGPREGSGGAARAEHHGVAKRAFQRLHVELRRRCMSYNPYRVPTRCRRPVLEEMAKAPPKPSRRVRKDRRRPAALTAVYTRRAASPRRWLATHFFHAKRFHMVSLWGHRLASHPTQRCQRKLYRYSKNKVLIHDRSYMQLLELRGTQRAIAGVLASCGADAATLLSKLFTSGAQRGRVSLFTAEESPDPGCLIGPVEFMWKPAERPLPAVSLSQGEGTVVQEKGCGRQPGSLDHADKQRPLTSNEVRTLWLWVHPSAYEAAQTELRKASAAAQAGVSARACGVTGDRFSEDEVAVHIEAIDDVAWFELTGPHALALLALTLKTPSGRSCFKRCRRHAQKVLDDVGESPLGVERKSGCESGIARLESSSASAVFNDQALPEADECPLAVHPQVWWRQLVHETLANGCCSSTPPGDAVLPLDVFLPPLLGPFPPRSRRLPGVPDRHAQQVQQGRRRLDEAQRHAIWCASRWPASGLFDKETRRQSTSASAESLWKPGRRSRKRQDLRRLLMRLKEKQELRQALTHSRNGGASKEVGPVTAVSGGKAPSSSSALDAAQRGATKRSYDSEWEDLPETFDARGEGKRRRQDGENQASEKGFRRGDLPGLGHSGLRDDGTQLTNDADSPAFREGDEDLGEVVNLNELPHEQSLVPCPTESSTAFQSANPDVGASANALRSVVSPVTGVAEGSARFHETARNAASFVPSGVSPATQGSEDAMQSGHGAVSRNGDCRSIPCLVVWRAPSSAPQRSFASPSSAGRRGKSLEDNSSLAPSRGNMDHNSFSGPAAAGFSGIDLFLPVCSGVARLFVLLCRYGARPIGCRDRRKLMLESGVADFPFDFPDTLAGTQAAVCSAWQDEMGHRRKPPGKRVNFAANATPCPFLPLWNLALDSKHSSSRGPPVSEDSHQDGSAGCDAEKAIGMDKAFSPSVASPALPDWACSAFSAHVRREYPNATSAATSFLPDSVLPWLVAPACQKSRKRASAPGFRANVPALPALPPVPSRLPFPEGLRPIRVLRVTQFDVLRVLAAQRRRRSAKASATSCQRAQTALPSLPGEGAATSEQGFCSSSRRTCGAEPLSADASRVAPRAAVQQFLAEMAGQLEAERAAGLSERPALQSRRRQRRGRKAKPGDANSVHHCVDEREGESVACETAAAERTAETSADPASSAPLVQRGDRLFVDASHGVGYDSPSSRSIETREATETDAPLPVQADDPVGKASASSVGGSFVPVQVEAHLRGVPRRLCQLYLMKEEDIIGFLKHYPEVSPAAAGLKRCTSPVSRAASALAPELSWLELTVTPRDGGCEPGEHPADVRGPQASGQIPPRQGRSRNVTRRKETGGRQPYSLEEPIHKPFKRSQLAKRLSIYGLEAAKHSPASGLGSTLAASATDKNPKGSSRVDAEAEKQRVAMRAVYVPRRAAANATQKREGPAAANPSSVAATRPGKPGSDRQDGALGHLFQTVVAALETNGGRVREHPREAKKQILNARNELAVGVPSSPPSSEGIDVVPEMMSRRHLIGFVTTGQHSLFRGKGFGIGCVSAEAFLEALRLHLRVLCVGDTKSETRQHISGQTLLVPRQDFDCRRVKLLVWLRNVQSRRYHPAWISLIVQD